LLLGQGTERVGVPHRPPANRHDGISNGRQDLAIGKRCHDTRAFSRAGSNPPDPVHVTPPTAMGEVGRLVGVPGAHQPIDLPQGLIPVQLGVAQRWFVAPPLGVERNGLRLAGFQSRQGLVKGKKARRDQPLAECARGIVLGNRNPPLGQDRTGVDARHRQMDRDAGVGIAVRDRPVDRLRPAMPWQQGWMNVEPAPGGHRQRLRRQDVIEARHHDHIRPIRPQRAGKGLGIGVRRHLDRAAEVPRDAGHEVGLWMGALPARAANNGDQVDTFLDQVQEERGPVVGRDAAEHDPESPIVEARTGVRPRGHLLEVDRDHRELWLRPDADSQVIEPGVVEGRLLVGGRLPHAIARRTIGGRWSSSPYDQPSKSITWTSGIS
jgi:hypothetical protein